MQRGSSLIEALVALALGGIVMACASTILFTGSKLYAEISQNLNSILAREKAIAAICGALRAQDRHRLSAGFVITDGSALSSRHPASDVKGTSAPRGSSDILSVAEINPLERGSISLTSRSASAINVRACNFYQRPKLTEIRSLLAVDLDGFLHTTGELVDGSNGCLNATLRPLDSIFTSQGTHRGSIHSLAPVAREISLYVDRSGQLRLLSHVGMRVIESQPIVRGLSFIRISEEKREDGVMLFNITVKPVAAPAASVTHFVSLTRRSIWNEVLG